MMMSDKWNLIVSNVQKRIWAKENEVQQLWENIFADANFFGYSRFSGEIDSQRNIHIGALSIEIDASNEIAKRFIGKRIPQQYSKRGLASPVLYKAK